MVIRRGAIYWADHDGDGRKPVLVVQAQAFNDSRLPTVLAAVLTSNTRVAMMPGNVFLSAAVSGLPQDAVADVTALVTLGKADLEGPIAVVPIDQMREVDAGLRRVLGVHDHD